MKKTILAAIMAVAGVAVSAFAADAKEAKMSLADACGKIAEAVEQPAVMQDIVSKLSPEDQVAYVAKVNAAIDSLKGSPDAKIAKYLDANMAAYKASAPGNAPKVLAETFATVPVEALVVINEEFAAKLLNRAADPEKVITDDNFTNIVMSAMDVIEKRNQSADDAGVRNVFAILMFVRASNGTPADLPDILVDRLGDATVRELAKTEWMGPALNEGNYEPLLAAADAGNQPEKDLIIRLSKPDLGAAMLMDLASPGGNGSLAGNVISGRGSSIPTAAEHDNSNHNTIPRSMNPNDKYFGGSTRGDTPQGEIPTYFTQETKSY